MRFMLGFSLALVLVLPFAAQADDDVWKLVWEDDFEREELGDKWFIRTGPEVRIVDGRLFMGSGAPVVLIDRPFAADVKVEFVAEADPEEPPCDISVAMAGSNEKGYGHLLAFGGKANQANQIVSGGAHLVDEDPPFLIEHGKKYKCVAVKEGPFLRYFVNDTKILETRVAEPLGGPGFDRVGLVTWNGMYVDYVKVYERTTPAPGGPTVIESMPDVGYRWSERKLSHTDSLPAAVQKGVDAYNNREYDRAIELLTNVSPPTLESVVALGYVLGDLAHVNKPEEQDKLVELAGAVADGTEPDSKEARFRKAAGLFRRVRIFPRDRIACTKLIQPGPENNPFYYKAKLFNARFHHASAVEGGDRTRVQEAREMFAELKKLWPEHEGLRGFTGESIPWGEELIHPESAGPAWARHLQEAFARQMAVLEWWFTERQFPDGQLGGGWGDDVEILRTWVSVACISSACEPAIAGIERMADGVWDHVLVDGYSPHIGDVEHEAEPSADSMPTMILLRYGDPLWVERNLRSAKTIREKFMGINDRGFLHFMSRDFGTNGVNRNPRAGGDSGYHARAMKHFIWLAWYGIPEARDVYLQWCDGWRDATMREIGNKPPGFAPATIWYPSGDIAPPNGRPWYDPLMNSYGFPGLPEMVHTSFLTAYFLSGDRKFLDPVQTMMQLATIGPLHRGDPSLPPDARENLLATITHQASPDITSVYRWLTGERVYDEYTLRGCSATQRYWIEYDLEAYGKRFAGLARSLRTNWAMRTSEVLQTDRAGLGGANDVLGAYTGAVCSFRDSRPPTLSVTYDTPDLNFAGLVTETTPYRLRLKIYSFRDEPTRMAIRPWRLVPSEYVLNQGEPVEGEKEGQHRYTWGRPGSVHLMSKGMPVWINVPSKKEWVVDLRLRGEPTPQPERLPDLAIAARDVRVEDGRLKVHVHNIGPAEAGAFVVVARTRQQQGEIAFWKNVSQRTVNSLAGIANFEPSVREVELKWPESTPTDEVFVSIDAERQVEERNEFNNDVVARP